MCTIVCIDQADSTNSVLGASAAVLSHGTVLAAYSQTAGRGQRGNSWESLPNMNLTFSVLLKPRTIMASRQFELLQCVAMSIAKVLRSLLGTDEIVIKWPNDIYYRDKKICGILIENSLMGHAIDRAVVGIGINVNQEQFYSDAPNPISMLNIAGHPFDLQHLLEYFSTQIIDDFDAYEANPNPTHLTAQYRMMLWRGEGYWPYHDNLRDMDIEGRIAAIAPTGHITVSTRDGSFYTYAFKELSAIF